MIPGAFGASVPKSAEVVTPDIVIVPLVAFDLSRGRLGYGGGFYDRTLEKLRAVTPSCGWLVLPMMLNRYPMFRWSRPISRWMP